MTANDLPGVAAVQSVDVKPGDVVVVRFQDRLPISAVESLRAQVAEVFSPMGVQVVVLEGGAEVVVLRNGGEDAPA